MSAPREEDAPAALDAPHAPPPRGEGAHDDDMPVLDVTAGQLSPPHSPHALPAPLPAPPVRVVASPALAGTGSPMLRVMMQNYALRRGAEAGDDNEAAPVKAAWGGVLRAWRPRGHPRTEEEDGADEGAASAEHTYI